MRSHVTCLHCGELTTNHAVCDKCFDAAEKDDGSFARRAEPEPEPQDDFHYGLDERYG